MKALRSTLLGLAVFLGGLGGCYAGPYQGGYYYGSSGYHGRSHGYYRPGYGYGDGRGYGHYGRHGYYGRGYGFYGRGYGFYAVPPPAPVCRRSWVPPHADFWGRWHPGHWRCV